MAPVTQTSIDQVSLRPAAEIAELRMRLASISPDDGKYYKRALSAYLSPEAEWLACVKVQRELLAVRVEFGQAQAVALQELDAALARFDPLNCSLIEDNVTHHDQLALLEELGRHISIETKALLHPGTTSYDILDTARSWLFRGCWRDTVRPAAVGVCGKLCALGEAYKDVLQVGRTHLQQTSPVLFGGVLAGYALRLASRIVQADGAFGSLKGKISGIVGTGASVEQVVGKGRAEEFEERVLARLNLKPDRTATQIVQKECLADVGHAMTTLMYVLADFANDMRILYSSEIGEVTAGDGKQRLGGSSADAAKNNPINWENIAGKSAVVESGMRVLYETIHSDLQRDLRGSVQGRYQPQGMIAEVYESLLRADKALTTLIVNSEDLSRNLTNVRRFPSEAMVAILRGHGYTHPEYGVGHDFVKEAAKKAKAAQRPVLEVALEDRHFGDFFEGLPHEQQSILRGDLELYLGSAPRRVLQNIETARQLTKPDGWLLSATDAPGEKL
jgi:adenylosuccinate lyase